MRKIKNVFKNLLVLVVAHGMTKLLLAFLPFWGFSILCYIIISIFIHCIVHYGLSNGYPFV